MIKAAIFDMDGVVVDNFEYHFKAWMSFAKKYNYTLNAQIYRDEFNGKTNADLFKMIFGDISTSQINAYAEEKENMYQELYRAHMKPHEGLLDFLKYLHESGIKVALGTSAPTSNVEFTLDNLDLRKSFEVIVDGTQVQKGKPDPQVYLLCAQKLGIDPKDCVVFEDSLAGLDSGKSAGCQIVGVATSHTADELKIKTDLIIKDFTQVRRLLNL